VVAGEVSAEGVVEEVADISRKYKLCGAVSEWLFI